MNGTIALSNEDYLSSAFEAIRRNISEEIRREPKHQILNVNEAQYIEHVLSKARLLVPEIAESGIQVETSEVEVPAEKHSPMWSVTPGRSYRRQKLTFEVPFSGDPDLFRFAPSHRSFSPLAPCLNRVSYFLNLSSSILRQNELKRNFRGL
jgi:hypothetical protein